MPFGADAGQILLPVSCFSPFITLRVPAASCGCPKHPRLIAGGPQAKRRGGIEREARKALQEAARMRTTNLEDCPQLYTFPSVFYVSAAYLWRKEFRSFREMDKLAANDA